MKNYSKLLALLMAVVLMLSFTTVALADDADQEISEDDVVTYDGTLTGDGTAQGVTISVVVPLNLDFSIDPLQISATHTSENQIYATSFAFQNKSEAPIAISLKLTASVTSAVKLVSDPAALSKDAASPTSKDLYLAAVSAKDVTGTIAFAASPSSYVFSYDVTTPTSIAMVSTSSSVDLNFALAKATGTDVTTVDKKITAAFTLIGEMNTYAGWEDGDIGVKVDYTLQALRPAYYAEVTTTTNAAGGLNQVKNVGNGVGFPGTTKSLTLAKATYASAGYEFAFNFGGKTVTSIVNAADSANWASNVTIDTTNNKIKLNPTVFSWPNQNVSIKITLSDNSTYTLNLVTN